MDIDKLLLSTGSINAVLDFVILGLVSTMFRSILSYCEDETRLTRELGDKKAHSGSLATTNDEAANDPFDRHLWRRYIVSPLPTTCQLCAHLATCKTINLSCSVCVVSFIRLIVLSRVSQKDKTCPSAFPRPRLRSPYPPSTNLPPL